MELGQNKAVMFGLELILHGLALHLDLGQVLISKPFDIFANQTFDMLY